MYGLNYLYGAVVNKLKKLQNKATDTPLYIMILKTVSKIRDNTILSSYQLIVNRTW